MNNTGSPEDAGPLQVRDPNGRIVGGAVLLNDAATGEDLLGRTPEIEAMAVLLAARDTQPPLSVGVFGDWGTGKTFFLNKLREEIGVIAQLAAAADPDEPSAMCRGIRQIVFNAWHYTDANLWASLVSAIFTELAEPRAGETDGAAQARWERERGRLVANLETTRQHLDEARSRHEVAEAELRRLRDLLDELAERRTDGREALTTMGAIGAVVRGDPRVVAQVEAAREDLELRAGVELEQIQRVAGDSVSTVARLARVWGMLRPGERRGLRWRLWMAGALAAALCVAVPVVLARFTPAVVQFFAGLVAFVAPLAVAGGRALGVLDRGLRKVEKVADAAAEVEQQLREQRAREEKALLADLHQLDAQHAELEREIVLAETRVREAERLVREAGSGRQLTTFVRERSGSADYRSQLGIIAMMRRDFDRLAKLLERARHEAGDVPPVERIVLYVDDLDRCPPERVVEVLQAVHLLLGLPLFVVVVAVDPRWLLSSLELHFEPVLGVRWDGAPAAEVGASHWAATPVNYLEKIFQIPYNLAPMSHEDFRRFVGHLLEPARAEAAAGATPVRPPALTLSPEECAVLAELGPLIGTPRATKRLVNLYRLTRASMAEESLDSLVAAGAHECVLLLLAVLVGAPGRAAALFADVLDADDDEPWERFVTRVVAAGSAPARVADVAPRLAAIDRVGRLKPWVPVVARYSFHTGTLGRPAVPVPSAPR